MPKIPAASALPSFDALPVLDVLPVLSFFLSLPPPLLPPAETSAWTALIASCRSCSEMWAYQMSRVRIPASWAIADRYARTDSSVTPRVSLAVKPLLRAAMVKLRGGRSHTRC
ncbi:MAG TPA: hypothetical protein VF241_02340 [Propionibacteriaceae bacterium]